MCNFCVSSDGISIGDSNVYLIGKELNVETICSEYHDRIIIPIEKCPFCGKELNQ